MSKALPYDATLCIGCKQCEEACAKQNKLPYDGSIAAESKQSDHKWTVVLNQRDKYMRRMCMHCADPTCRYCMLACPFNVPKPAVVQPAAAGLLFHFGHCRRPGHDYLRIFYEFEVLRPPAGASVARRAGAGAGGGADHLQRPAIPGSVPSRGLQAAVDFRIRSPASCCRGAHALLLPLALLLQPRVRRSAGGLYLSAVLVVLGFVINRLNVSITGMEGSAGLRYIPKWTEAAVTLSIVAAGFAIFGLAAKYLPTFPGG